MDHARRGNVHAHRTFMESADKALGRWWDKAHPTFAHIRYDNWLGSEAKVIADWKRLWLDEFCSRGTCHGRRVLEYGIGAGLLGETLLSRYNVSHYTGIDVSDRQLERATRRLQRFGSHRFVLLNTTTPFDFPTRPQLLISQQVIQHFPSQSYLDRFLERVERSGAARVMLQTRAPVPGKSPVPGKCAESVDYCQGVDVPKVPAGASAAKMEELSRRRVAFGNVSVAHGTMTSTRYVSSRLPSYRLAKAIGPLKKTHFVYHTFVREAPTAK